MSFQAYLRNVEEKTGVTPVRFRELAVAKGYADATGISANVRPMQVVNWLKEEFGLGHGHAMAVVAFLKGKRE